MPLLARFKLGDSPFNAIILFEPSLQMISAVSGFFLFSGIFPIGFDDQIGH
jgi:hypothetical protein